MVTYKLHHDAVRQHICWSQRRNQRPYAGGRNAGSKSFNLSPLVATRRPEERACLCSASDTGTRSVVDLQTSKGGVVHVLSSQHHVISTHMTSHAEHPLWVSFAGGGIYFFWQLGAVKQLKERFDLTKVPMAGASSGALVACLAACGVDPELIFEEAYQLSLDNDIWNRKFGLLGIWGGLIREWLDRLLPDNAHELCSHRLHVIIAKAPTLDLFEVNRFDSKEDLIEAVMASAHVPFFLDGRPFLQYREQACWDGSFPDFFYSRNSELLERDNSTLIVDYSMDAELEWTKGDFLKLRDYTEIQEMMHKGERYMKLQIESGAVGSRFNTDGVDR